MLFELFLFLGATTLVRLLSPPSNILIEGRERYLADVRRLDSLRGFSEVVRKHLLRLERFGKIFIAGFVVVAAFHFVSIYPSSKLAFTAMMAFGLLYFFLKTVANCLKNQIEKLELDKDMTVMGLVSSLSDEFRSALVEHFKNREFERYHAAKAEKDSLDDKLEKALHWLDDLRTQNAMAEQTRLDLTNFRFCETCWSTLGNAHLPEPDPKIHSPVKNLPEEPDSHGEGLLTEAKALEAPEVGNSVQTEQVQKALREEEKKILRKNQSENNFLALGRDFETQSNSSRTKTAEDGTVAVRICQENCFEKFFEIGKTVLERRSQFSQKVDL